MHRFTVKGWRYFSRKQVRSYWRSRRTSGFEAIRPVQRRCRKQNACLVVIAIEDERREMPCSWTKQMLLRIIASRTCSGVVATWHRRFGYFVTIGLPRYRVIPVQAHNEASAKDKDFRGYFKMTSPIRPIDKLIALCAEAARQFGDDPSAIADSLTRESKSFRSRSSGS
jgi:hypothetical protein